MASQHNLPDGQPEEACLDDAATAPQGGPIILPAHVTTVLAEDLRARLVFAVDQDEEVLIDAGETESIGQAGLQLLVAARREADRLDLPFAIRNMNDALAERLVSLGLADALGLSTPDLTQEEAV